MSRVAAIDCGTNSLRLLIADLDPAVGVAVDIDRRTTIVRLGQGVDTTGAFADEALARTFGCLDIYAQAIEAAAPERIRFVATSASRDVANRDSFATGVRARLGVEPEVISGDEEAALTYAGATRELSGRPGARLPLAVADIGGGSTEVVTRIDGHLCGASVDIGSVRMTERHIRSDPPDRAEIVSCDADIARALDASGIDFGTVGTLVGVAGTITTVAAMGLGLTSYERHKVHLARLSASAIGTCTTRLLDMTVAERRSLGFMDPGRADVIAAGAMILRAVVARCEVDAILVSEHDILDGVAWSIA